MFQTISHPSVQSELRSGEKVIWADRPIVKDYAKGSYPTFIFGLVFVTFTLFWLYMVKTISGAKFDTSLFSSGPMQLFPIMGLVFLAIGIFLLLTPLFRYQRGKQMIYVITNQRAIQIKDGKQKSVTSYSVEDFDEIQRIERSDGSGNLFFAKSFRRHKRRGRPSRTRVVRKGFIAIPNVKSAETALNRLISSEES